jgi:hypothetical protein
MMETLIVQSADEISCFGRVYSLVVSGPVGIEPTNVSS